MSTSYYRGAPDSVAFGQLTQTSTGTYTATKFIPGERDVLSEGNGPSRRPIPISVEYTIPKGTEAGEASAMLNAILVTSEKPKITLVGGNPERVKAVWFSEEVKNVNCASNIGPDVDWTRGNGTWESIAYPALLYGNASQDAYTKNSSASTQFTVPVSAFRQLPPKYYDLGTVMPLHIPIPRNCHPKIYLRGDPLPTGRDDWQVVTDITISVCYGYLETDAALSSKFVIAGGEIGGFWDWAAKILQIVVKVAEVVLPLIEALASPSATHSDFAKLHPKWNNLSDMQKSEMIGKVGLLYAALSRPRLRPLNTEREGARKGGQHSSESLRLKNSISKKKSKSKRLSSKARRTLAD